MSKVKFRQHCDYHEDVPSHLRPAFVKHEQAWAAQVPREVEYFTQPSSNAKDWIPIGVGSMVAAGFSSQLAQAHRNRLALVEQDQFAKVWINTLLRCTFRAQYDAIHKRFCTMYKRDPSLHMAAKMVLKCEPLIKFRDELPKDRSGLNNAIAFRKDGKYITWEEAKDDDIDIDPLETFETVFLHLLHYRDATAKWKRSIEFHCFPDTLPTAHITRDNELYVAYYVSKDCVKMIHFNDKQKPLSTWYCSGMKGPLVCDVDVVTDGHIVACKNGQRRHKIEGQIISSIKQTPENLYLGTFAGHVYNVTKSTYVKTRDPLAVLAINASGDGDKYIIQSINDVTFDERLLNIGRPLCSAIKGTMVVSLSKYGIISICFMGATSFFEPPKGVTCDLNCILRYYKDGIWIRDDGGEIVVLYPDGRVCLKRLSEATHI